LGLGSKVVTLTPKDGTLKGVPFRLANLSEAQKTALGSSTEQGNVLNYLRGDTTNQSTLTARKAYRYRASALGDIVDSGALYVGPPNQDYSDACQPGLFHIQGQQGVAQTGRLRGCQ
jgi:Tfp pilus tip-associated adhesin PilY1